jgi:AraC-like DNA-binding protein
MGSKGHKPLATPGSLFDTSLLPPPARFAAWRDSMGVLLDIAPAGSQSLDAFNSRLESYLLDDILLSRLTTTAQKIQRTGARFARDSIDSYGFNFFLSGSVELTRPIKLRYGAGHLIGFDNAEGLACEVAEMDVITATVPRRRLAPLLTHPDSVHANMVDPASGIGILLAGLLQTFFMSASRLTRAEAGAAASSLLNLLAVALNGTVVKSGDLPDMLQQAELLRIPAFIKNNLASPKFGPTMIMAAMAISRAQLYRLFAPSGGVAEYIREQRLRRCLADLLSLKCAHEQIAAIAYRWGFRDPAYFANAFKQRFGRTPSEARESSSPASRGGQADIDGRVGDRLYEDWLVGIA